MSTARAPSRRRLQPSRDFVHRTRSEATSHTSPGARVRDRAAPLVVVLLAIALRLINLGHSYWGDEQATVRLLRQSFWQMLRHGIPGSESTPPLYYVIASAWSHVFGTSEVAVRSLTALIGVATVVVAYAIGVELRSRRAGLILSTFVAVSPLMVWFSQDARAYGLMVLLTSVGLLFFAQALRTSTSKSIWLWALASALALTAHYFAIFVVVPEALVLLLGRKTRSRAVWPTASVGTVWLVLVPLLLFQRSQAHHLSWITFLSLLERLKMTLQFFATGSWNLSFALLAIVAAVIAAVIAVAFAAHRIHRRELIILGVGVSGLLLPIIASLVGFDYVNYQNLLTAWMPFAAVLASALAGLRRVGALFAVVLGGVALAATVKIQATPALQTPNWRLAAETVSAEPPNTVFVEYPDFDAGALLWYNPGVSIVKSAAPYLFPKELGLRSVRTRRIVILAEDPWVYSAAHTLVLHAPPGFHQVSKTAFSTFVLVTDVAPHPERVAVDPLVSMRPSGYLLATSQWRSTVFFDRHVAPRASAG